MIIQIFDEYAKMSRSQQGLSGAGEWHQFKALFPDLSGKKRTRSWMWLRLVLQISMQP